MLGARLLDRGQRQHAAHPGGGAARPPVLHQHARVDQLVRQSSSRVGVRRADDPRARRVHRAAGSSARAATRSKTLNLQSDLDYVRGIHSVRTGLQLDGGVVSLGRLRTNYLGTYTFESLDAFQAGTPRSYTQPRRRPEHRLQERAGGRLPAGRHPRPQEPDAQPRHPLRGADAPRPTTTTSGRASASPGRRARAARRRCAAAPASSTTGCPPAPTSRRCASTASASAS